MVTLDVQTDSVGKMTIAGSSAKTTKAEVTVDAKFNDDADKVHIRTLGRLIEDNEGILRN
jgi:hypothetical protein